MINVSPEYEKSVYAPSRLTKGRVSFEILDNEAYKDNIKIVTDQCIISNKEQLTNKIRRNTYKYATFESNYFRLDGSFVIPPKNINDEVGWWSNTLCGADGMFTPYQVITFEFNKEHSSMGLTIFFDVLNSEYATMFDIDIYSPNGTVLKHIEATNDSSRYELVEQLDGYKNIKITIKKWCNSYRRAKVTEVDFGIIREYEDSKLIKLNILEEMDILSDTLPSNELKFTVDNSDKAFNILNPQGFYKFLKEKQEIKAEIGIELEDESIEYIPMGKYYLKDWQSDEGALTTTFTARDILDRLEEDFNDSIVGDTNLYNIAKKALDKVNIDYEIDEKLKLIPTKGYLPKATIKQLIQYVAIAGMCAVYQDRITEKLTIKQFKTLDESESYIYFCGNDLFCGLISPEVNKGFSMKQIDFDNAYEAPKITLDKLIKSVDIVMSDYVQEVETKEILNTTISIDGQQSLFVSFSNPIYDNNPIFTLTGATTYNIIKVYSNGAYLNITGNGDVTIKATAHQLVIQKTTFTLEDSSIKEGTTLKIENPLIDTPEVAKQVAEWVYKESRLRALYEVNWRQNPALELSDIVIIEDSYGEKKQSRILKQEFNYEGYLKGKTSTKGGV